MREVYLDNSATTKVCDRAINEIMHNMKENYGNPSSTHLKGYYAEEALDKSREVIAKFINCDKKELIFTSGGTEANNIAIMGTAMARKNIGRKIVTSYIEHASVLGPMGQLEKNGFEVVYLKPDKYGNISLSQLSKAIDKNTILVSLMFVNNEIGSFMPIEKVKNIIKNNNSNAIFHTDAVQAFGKIPIDVKKLGIDLMSISSHKVHGPKGVGALYISKGVKVSPISFGGGQEMGISPGTEPMPAISGFKGAVLEIGNPKEVYGKVDKLNKYCRSLLAKNKNIIINSPDNATAYIINISVKRIKSETMTNYLSSNGIYVSNGSACSKGKRSHVLSAIGLENSLIDSSIRISFSRYTDFDDIDYFVKILNEGIEKLIKF